MHMNLIVRLYDKYHTTLVIPYTGILTLYDKYHTTLVIPYAGILRPWISIIQHLLYQLLNKYIYIYIDSISRDHMINMVYNLLHHRPLSPKASPGLGRRDLRERKVGPPKFESSAASVWTEHEVQGDKDLFLAVYYMVYHMVFYGYIIVIVL